MIKYRKVKKGYISYETVTYKTKIIPKKEIKQLFCSLDSGGVVTILPGFWWDGATGAVDTDSIRESSLVHDSFCNWHDEGLITDDQIKQANRLFKEMNKASGMSKTRVKWTYQAVRKWREAKGKMSSFFN